MVTDTSLPVHRAPAGGRSDWLVAGLVARRAARQGALWGLAFGAVIVTSVSGYASAYPTAAARAGLETSLGTNPGLQALLGPARRIGVVAGFTAWRGLGFVMLVGAVWAMLAGTRLVRGEEEAGRWEILLAGQTTRRRAAAQALVGLAAGWGALFATTAMVVVAEGQTSDARFSVSASLFFALALSASAGLFLAAGAFASQLAGTRRQAATMVAGAFGVAFVVRMVAASASGLRWMRWVSPLGWIDTLHPLTGSQPLALVPLAMLIGALAWGTVRLAGARDLGASALPDHERTAPHTRLLGGPTGLAVRLNRPVAVGWLVGLGGVGLLMGLVAKAATASITRSKSVQEALARLGAHTGGAGAYLGFAFVFIATMAALVAAGEVSATREEEAEGRLENLLVRPVGRFGWLAGRVGVAAVLIVTASLAGGVLAFVGAASQGSGVSLGRMLEAGLNVAPPALFVLGIGMLVYGATPRLAPIVAYALVVWSFLLELVGATIRLNHWLLDTSILRHIAPVPAVNPNWTSAGILFALGVAAAGVGAVLLERRDLVGA
jgi:ABC-2 type transport system permease protein